MGFDFLACGKIEKGKCRRIFVFPAIFLDFGDCFSWEATAWAILQQATVAFPFPAHE